MRKAMEAEPRNAGHIYWPGRIDHARGEPELDKPLFKQYVKRAPDTYNAQDLKNNREPLLNKWVLSQMGITARGCLIFYFVYALVVTYGSNLYSAEQQSLANSG